jgi:hypothetical protein
MSFLDQFATEVNFTYNRQLSYKTCCGGVVSIIVMGILGVYLVYLLNIMVRREFPDTIVRWNFAEEGPPSLNILYDPTYDVPNVNKTVILPQDIEHISYFYTSIALRDTNNRLLTYDPRVIKISVKQVDLFNNTFIYTDKSFKPCTKFGDFSLHDYDYLTLNYTYCINDNFAISGFPGKEGSSYLEVKFSVCKNDPTCLPSANVSSIIKGAKIEFYYQSNIINATSTEKVVTGTIEQTYWDIVPSFTKISTIQIGLDNLESYDSYLPDFIWNKKSYHSALVIRDIATKLSDIDTSNNILVLRISNSRISKLTERRFVDLITQLGKIGGIIGIPVMFGTLFVFLFANFEFKVNMTNVFYNIIDPSNTKNVSKSFNSFLKEHYNFLMTEYEKLRERPEKEMELQNITQKQQQEIGRTEDAYEKKLNYLIKCKLDNNIFEKLFTLSKIEKMFGLNINDRRELLEEFKGRNYKLDEGKPLLSSQGGGEENVISVQPLKTEDDESKFFREQSSNLGEKESQVEKITREKSDLFELEKMLKQQKSRKSKNKKNKDSRNYYSFFLKNRERTIDYYKYSILYQIFKFINYDKLLLKPYELFLKLFCGCCIRRKSVSEIKENMFKKNNNGQKETILQKRCDILETASERMTIDFDLAYLLKSVYDFEKFIIILFTEEQLSVYKSVAKPTITLALLNDKSKHLIDDLEEVAGDESERDKKHMDEFEEFLNQMTHREIEDVDLKLMRIMGLSFEQAYKFQEAVNKNIRQMKLLEEKVKPEEIVIEENSLTEANDPLLAEDIPDPNKQIGDKEALEKIFNQYKH